jgi:hypothetical protein
MHNHHESLPQDPFQVDLIEQTAREGFETYKGVRSLEFRVGIEMEFQIGKPARVRSVLDELDADPDRKRQIRAELLNPEIIEVETPDNTEVLTELQEHARGFIGRLRPENDTEQATKTKWLGEIDDFGADELINFMLYEEFSTPQLGIPVVPENASLAQVDAFGQENGWLEWRFGTGSLQTGYYDNAAMSEIRLTPCSPSEALHRSSIIKQRLKELGGQFGLLVRATPRLEHINVSAYDISQPEESSIIGNGAAKAEDTVDATSGVMKAYQDNININPTVVKDYDYMFSKYSTTGFRVGPTRKTLRVLDGRVELRGDFSTTANGVAWVTAGIVEGLSEGADGLRRQGYDTSVYSKVVEVQRTPEFDKDTDLQIQRAFENSEKEPDGTFNLDVGYETMRSLEIDSAMFGVYDHPGLDVRIAVAATKVREDGSPFVTADSLRATREATSDTYKRLVGNIDEDRLESVVAILNDRLNTIRIIDNMAVIGRAERVGMDKQAIFAKLAGSRVVNLALGGDASNFIRDIDNAAREYAAKRRHKP